MHTSQKNKKRVLLLEPNYSNKYPPMGLMKLASYHRQQGYEVVFFKGDYSRFVADQLTEVLVQRLSAECAAQINWRKGFSVLSDFVRTGNDSLVSNVIQQANDEGFIVSMLLSGSRDDYKRRKYFSSQHWDRVCVSTLFTFYAKQTIEAIRFAKRLVPSTSVYVGGVMASVVPHYIEQETGINPHVGLLTVDHLGDDPHCGVNIDDFPLDYSILDEIDYEYPETDSYYAYTTRGCPNRCSYCVVPKIEPDYRDYAPLKDRLLIAGQEFGQKRNLLLLDNNVFASKKFFKIINEIKACGYKRNSFQFTEDPLKLCVAHLEKKHNTPAYCRKTTHILQEFAKTLSGDDLAFCQEILTRHDLDSDWHAATPSKLLAAITECRPIWSKRWKPRKRLVHVDFNQGLDARRATDAIMAKLAEIPIKPVRIAFDNWKYRHTYERAVRLAAKYGHVHLSNYLLYNFKDTPIELYYRLAMNVHLSEELKISIYSFPMKYHPIDDPAYFLNRDFLGPNWTRKSVRAIQSVLNSTKGKIGRGKVFFFKAFGRTPEEFHELLRMPECFIINRWDAELNTDHDLERWREDYSHFKANERTVVDSIIDSNNFVLIADKAQGSSKIARFIETYYNRPNDYVRPAAASLKREAIRRFNVDSECLSASDCYAERK